MRHLGSNSGFTWLLWALLVVLTCPGACARFVSSSPVIPPRHIEVRNTDNITETIQERIMRVTADLKAISEFYNIEVSPSRVSRLQKYYEDQLAQLKGEPFDLLDQQDKVDYLLIQNYLKREQSQLNLEKSRDEKAKPLLPFASIVIRLCEDRQKMKPMDARKAAGDLHETEILLLEIKSKVEQGNVTVDKTSAFRAAQTVDELITHLTEWFGFFNGYDPLFTWWASQPYTTLNESLAEFGPLIREKLVGTEPGEEEDAIVGQPIGREGLAVDLEAEMIPYTPEELMEIGETEYEWCEKEMIKASNELGYGDDWRLALEYVKTLHVDPGQQPQLVHDLAVEAIDYMNEHDLVTIPPLATEIWRMVMMPPERQKVSPFFLGGEKIMVSYPTDTMGHEEKLMSMRGNSIHLSRSTVFHELIPGHNLQMYMNARHRPYRQLFDTPFWMEGWALYWEMILWDKGFPATPENRVGMLFWRMHRCARIVFSLKFHLGEMTPQQCIDYLVVKVGHERSTAEGEVRRSFGGEYTPLYQAGYMLGALQLYAFRQEVVDNGNMSEKAFHDRILRENEMPIELLRALITEQDLAPDFKPSWKFYDS